MQFPGQGYGFVSEVTTATPESVLILAFRKKNSIWLFTLILFFFDNF